MKVTILDVAKKAGVSIATVSRVINGNYPVKESTRDTVQKVIDELQFEPNVLARGLINQKSNTIGVIVPSITNLFFPTVVKAIERKLRHMGYSIFLCDTDGESDKEISYVKSLASRQVDGIIVIDPSTENMKNGYFEEQSKEIPMVFINGYSKDINCNFVLNNEQIGTTQAMNYLLSGGHKNIAFIRGKDSYSYDIKQEIYASMMKENNTDRGMYIVNIGEGNTEHTVEQTMKKIEELLINAPDITAIFACNDIMALGVINACKRQGKHIPNQISVIGFDNIALSSLIEPKLTTVDQNMYGLGTQAADMLIEVITQKSNNKKYPNTRKIILNTTLIIRESCTHINKNTLGG